MLDILLLCQIPEKINVGEDLFWLTASLRVFIEWLPGLIALALSWA